MNIALRKSLACAITGLIISFGATQQTYAAQALKIMGLTSDGRLVSFLSNNPSSTTEIGTIADAAGKSLSLIGIDFRVQDGNLYGVSSDGNIYTINTSTATATMVSSLTVPLSGTSFGVDFNPAADRLRIVSDTGQNLRHNVNVGGTTTDDSQAGVTPLTYTAPPTTPVAALGIVGAAYTNNDLSTTTATTLFDIDANLGQIAIQAPPNNGILNLTGMLDIKPNPATVGFDIYSTISKKGLTLTNQGFASFSSNDSTKLYSVKILTGALKSLGSFNEPIVDIAVMLNQ